MKRVWDKIQDRPLYHEEMFRLGNPKVVEDRRNKEWEKDREMNPAAYRDYTMAISVAKILG